MFAVVKNASSTFYEVFADVSKNFKLYFYANAAPSAKLTSRLSILDINTYSLSRSILFPTRIIAIFE
jgi:hypothetical protein